MEILLANPRGFCAGVERAISIVERALELFGPPIYVRHEIVHNRHVVENLRARGTHFVKELNEVPDGALVIFSAHGVPQSVSEAAARRDLRVYDSTCPLVTKVHLEVARHAREGRDVILIGHAGHPEVIGTMGRYPTSAAGHIHLVQNEQEARAVSVNTPDRLAFVTQTTLSVDDAKRIIEILRQRFPLIQGPNKDDICYATQNRQDAVKQLAGECDLVLVVGSANSSNSNRLREIAAKQGTAAYLVDDAEGMDRAWFDGVERIGITAGASAPERLVEGIIEQLQAWGARPPRRIEGTVESAYFPLPVELRG